MKTARILLPVIAVVAGGLLVLRDSAAQPARRRAAPATRVAVCDIIELLDNYQRAKDLMAALRNDGERIEREREARRKKIEQMNQQLDGLKSGSPAFRKMLDKMEEARFEGEAWLKFQGARGMREHHRLTKLLYADIQDAIAKIAKARGIHVVLSFDRKEVPTKTTVQLAQLMESRKVIWHDESIDLTEAVLVQLNKEYQARKP